MYGDHTVGVVVPAYNEAGKVGRVVETLPSYVDRAYVVDDGSTDGTWAEIRSAAETDDVDHPPSPGFDERVVPIRHAENRGVGAAIRTGYRRALADGVDVTAVMGGDGQMDPAVLPSLLDPVVEGRADYAKGNRFLAPDDLDAMPRFRLVGNRVLSALTKVASGYWGVSDPQNGYSAISHEALDAIDLDDLFTYYGYCNDLLVRLNVVGMRVADVAHSAASVYDEEWDSHIRYTRYVPRVSGLLLRCFLWRLGRLSGRRLAHPVVVSYSLGTGLAVVGLVLLAIQSDALVGTALLALGTWILGTGALLDRQGNRHLAVRVAEGPAATRSDPPLERDVSSTDDD